MAPTRLGLRPAPPAVHPATTQLEFQILAVEVSDTPIPHFDRDDRSMLTKDIYYRDDDEAATQSFYERAANACGVYVFGVTALGNSVVVRVSKFMPHFYVELKGGITADLLTRCARAVRDECHLDSADIRIEYEHKKRVYGWIPAQGDVNEVRKFRFARVYFKNTWLLRRTAWKFREKALGCLRNLSGELDISEARVAPSEKFLAAHNLRPSAWAALPPGKYQTADSTKLITMAQIEVTCRMGALVPLANNSIAPIVIASVDIEAQSHDYRSMVDAAHKDDWVTYIGTTFWVYGDTKPRARVMQVLGDCHQAPPTSNLIVKSYASEYDLLVGWRDLIAIHANPECMVSYNGTGFDYAYLSQRMERLCKERGAGTRFNHLGRFLMQPNPLKERELSSSAKGENILRFFPQPGRFQLDLMMYVKDSQKLSSYSLDSVSEVFLPDSGGKVVLDFPGWVRGLIPAAASTLAQLVQADAGAAACVDACMCQLREACPESGDYAECHKILQKAVDAVGCLLEGVEEGVASRSREAMDTHVQPLLDATSDNNYRRLFRLYDAGPAARAAIAVYCQVDCDLVVQLLERLNVVANTMQMSQVCNTLVDDVCNRGQQIKTFNLIARQASARGYVMNHRETGWDPEDKYEGATVLEPIPGYYQTPVSTLDFASLYPSLMRGYNLCFSSLVLDPQYTDLPGVKYGRYNIAGKEWVFQESTPGLLPDILGSLLQARRDKKREMKRYAKNSMEYRLCDGAQLALKVSCNSVYGFCGVMSNPMFQCLPVAVATTYNGREAIAKTKKFVESNYNATVVYGDTDSVMLTFPGINNVRDAFTLAERVAAETSAIFPDTVVLEFEKVFFPYLLLKRKTYSGLKYEDDPDAPPSLDVKGLAMVRRDNCGLAREVMGKVLNLTMRDNDPMAAYAVVSQAVEDLVADRVDLSLLQITKSLKKPESYANTAQPQLVVVDKMVKRRAFNVPRPGDRVPYVIILDAAHKRVSYRAEHPKYVEEHPGVKVDIEYYLINQLKRRLEGILALLPVPDVEQLFSEAVERVRNRSMNTSCMAQFGIASAPAPRAKKRAPVAAPRMDTSSMSRFVSAPKEARTEAPAKRKARATKADVDKKVVSLLSF